MTRFFTAALIFSLFSFSALAASTTIGIIDDQTGDLIIQVLDDPGTAQPYDAATLWGAIKGSDSKKIIQSDSVTIKCNTSVTEPRRQRFGSCLIEVKAHKVSRLPEGFGTLISGAEAREILSAFTGSENPDFPRTNDIRLANNKLWITADHPTRFFSLLILHELIQ